MPHPIVYIGTQDDDRTRSIDVVHIEPSIREGVHLVSSLYGSDASAPLYRYPPTNTVEPWISGDTQIPNTLTCNEGQWPASPAASFAYQWMSDGTDIPGETNRTYTTDESVDNTHISCEVRGYNYLGEAYALTPSVAVSLIEPIETREMEDYVVTGLEAKGVQTTNDVRTVFTSGIGAQNRLDINRSVAYFFTGRSADKREDINTFNVPVITGLQCAEVEKTRFTGIGVINWDTGKPLEIGVPQTMNLKNPNAEMGIAGWEVFGAAERKNLISNNFEGDYVWWGGADVDSGQDNIPYSYLHQNVEVFPIWQADVDAGECSVYLQWYQSSYAWEDYANVKVEFLDANENLISLHDGAGLTATRGGYVWTMRSFEAPVPANCRFVKVIVEFSLQEGTDNNAYVDYVLCQIFKGERNNSRSYGPNFEQWRLNFTQANTWSGVALSELEFRDSQGGADLATGGNEIVGSEGIGGLAIYAFDDLRNTGYWAGEENGVALGSAWIGYNMGTPVRPEEIDITARTGSNSLQVGTDFTLEGSDDGVFWTAVQRYEDIGSFASGEQRQFEVVTGAFPYTIEQDQIDGGSTVRSYSSVNQPSRGGIFEARTRMNITHLRGYFEEAGIDCKLGICKITFQDQYGIFYDWENTGQEIEGGTTTDTGYVEVALTEDFEVEVGDFFVVFAVDKDNTQGKIAHFDNTQPKSAVYAVRNRSWGSTETEFVEGIGNNWGNSSYFFDVDFRGNIF